MSKGSKVRILYKSGNSIDIACKDFGVKYVHGKLQRVEWDSAVPQPLFIGIDDIEAIWELP